MAVTKLLAATLAAAALGGCGMLVEIHDPATDAAQCKADMLAMIDRGDFDAEPSDACIRDGRNQTQRIKQELREWVATHPVRGES